MPNTPTHHIARSALWNHLGKLTEYSLLYLSSVIIARELGVDRNGQLAGILSIVQLLIVLSAAGVEISLNKYLPQLGDASPGSRFLVVRLLRFRILLYATVAIITSVLLLLVPLPIEGKWRDFLTVIIVLGLLRSITPVLSILMVARFRTGQAAAIGVLARGVEVVALLLAGDSISISLVMTILITGETLQVLGIAIASRTEWAGDQHPIPLKPIVAFGAVFWLNTFIDYFLGRQGDIMFLTTLLPDSSPASLYDVAYSIVQIGLMALTVGFSGVSLAALSGYAATNRASMNRYYEMVVRLTSLLTIPALTFLFVAAPDILYVVYSNRYAGAADILRAILVLRILSRLFATGENADYLLARGNVWTVVRIGGIAACATVVMHLILIPRWGAIGAACAGGTGVLLANAMGGLAVMRLGGVTLQWQAWIRTTLAAAGAGLVSYFVPHFGPPVIQLCLDAVVFISLFTVLLILVRPLRSEDLTAIQAAIGRIPRPLQWVAQQ
jgi:O-antigen/teichoic acid export membrane protein